MITIHAAHLRTGLMILFLFTNHASFSQATTESNRISEERYININGIEQWVTIKGDSTKPVILFLHGGPGSTLSPYADTIFGKWEKDFVLVQWDQRGAGRTYGRNIKGELTPELLKSNRLVLEQMLADGIVLTEYLLQRLKKPRIILIGTSWGSVLGAKMAIKRPALFYAYVGHSQVVDFSLALSTSYSMIYKKTEEAKDNQALALLDSIGEPPYVNARTTGQLMRIIKKYQLKNSTPAPDEWFKPSPAYDNDTDRQQQSDGDDYSFVNYTGDKNLGVPSIGEGINLFNDGLRFEVPVYFIQGAADIQTPPAIINEYYNEIDAPAKDLFMLTNTAHDFNQPVVDALYTILKRKVLPLTRNK